MRDESLIVIHAFGSQAEAEMARGALQAAGIAAMIPADAAGGMQPPLAWATGGFKLLVREEDTADALDVLNLPDEEE